MPKRSAEAKAIARIAPPDEVEVIERPAPPPDLNRDQADEWTTFVNRMPADWFGAECHPLLASLCRHVCYSRQIAGELEDVEKGMRGFEQAVLRDDPEIKPGQLAALVELRLNRRSELTRLFNMHTASITSLSTKLRLTPQSKYHPDTIIRNEVRGRSKPSKMPWDDE